MYSVDTTGLTCEYALIGPALEPSHKDMIQASSGLVYDRFYVTFSVVAKGDAACEVKWHAAGNVSDAAAADAVLESFWIGM